MNINSGKQHIEIFPSSIQQICRTYIADDKWICIELLRLLFHQKLKHRKGLKKEDDENIDEENQLIDSKQTCVCADILKTKHNYSAMLINENNDLRSQLSNCNNVFDEIEHNP